MFGASSSRLHSSPHNGYVLESLSLMYSGPSNTPDLNIEVKQWEGRVVFSEEIPPYRSGSQQSALSSQSSTSSAKIESSQPFTTPKSKGKAPLDARQGSQGTCTSPISISSDSSPEKLPRPRAQTRYSTELAKTAYTPPHPIPPKDQPVHPFFKRDFTRSRSTPPPASNRPRLVATYSSTSVSSHNSQISESTVTESSQSQDRVERKWLDTVDRPFWEVGKGKRIELVSHSITPSRSFSSSQSESEEEERVEKRYDSRADELEIMMRDLSMHGPTQSHRPSSNGKAPYTLKANRPPLQNRTHITKTASRGSPRSGVEPVIVTASTTTKQPSHPNTIHRDPFVPPPRVVAGVDSQFPNLPVFTYKTLTPRPKVAYTSDPAEAEMLLGCLKGNIMGFDMEWPIPGQKGADGKSIGMSFDSATGKMKFSPGKTGLMQFCDEHLVVLVQVHNMQREYRTNVL